VKFHVYEKVTEVFIAPKRRILIPPIDRAAGLEDNISSPEAVPGPGKDLGEMRAAKGAAADVSEIAAEMATRRARLPRASLPPELTSTFRLDSPRSDKSGFTLNIVPAESEASETKREMTGDELDLLSYLRPDTAHTQPLRGTPSRTIRAGVSSRGQPATPNTVEYDITPWAERAVARIQRNWIIPPTQGKGDKKAVEIAIVVAKSGELLSFAIRNSSGLAPLDKAALDAVKMSLPFPSLPDDFPLDRLEADLLFQYYE
jgi:TonB family protein